MIKKVTIMFNYIFLVAILYTLYGIFRSEILDITLINSTIFNILLFLLLISIVFQLPKPKKWIMERFQLFGSFFLKNIRLISTLIFCVTIFMQFFILLHIYVPIGWDVTAIHDGVAGVSKNTIASDYLSVNPNNSFFFFIMLFFNKIGNLIHSGLGYTWIYWQSINIIFMDLGFVCIYLAARNLFNYKVGYTSFYLSLISLGLSPWILVPYTDTIMLPLIGVIFYLFSLLRVKSNYLCIALIGFLTAVAFLLKPSSIIFLISYSLILVLNLMSSFSKIKLKKIIIISILFSTFFVGTLKIFNTFEDHQSIVLIDKNKAKPWQHFVMMGLTGSGGFNQNDTNVTNSFSNKEDKVVHATNTIVKRLKDYGINGYVKFLLKKHINNTDRGDFGWGRDGTPQIAPDTKNSITNILRDSYYQQGERVKTLRFFMQIMWIITFLGLVFIAKRKYGIFQIDNILTVLKLAILGAFLYLLLFEGGRSRYLIQYLPIFYILSANGWYLKFSDLSEKFNHYMPKS